jgi:hypothetical protein
VFDKTLPANHQYRAAALMHLAQLLVDRNKGDEALRLSEESLAIWNESAPKSWYTAQAHTIHAYALAHSGRTREATDELTAALPVLLAARGPDDPSVRRAQTWLRNLGGSAPPGGSARTTADVRPALGRAPLADNAHPR